MQRIPIHYTYIHYSTALVHTPVNCIQKKPQETVFVLRHKVLAFFLRGCKQSNPSSIQYICAILLA